MNLYLRLLFVLVFSKFKSRVPVLDPFKTNHRVLPNDVDVFGHMNNGRYFTLTDIVRIELLIRAGVWEQMKMHNIYPVIAGETIQFRKPLGPFQKYSIVTRTLGWDEKFIYVEHCFQSAENIHALMMVRVRIIGDGAVRISPQQVLNMIDHDCLDATRMNDVIAQWTQSASTHWHDLNHSA